MTIEERAITSRDNDIRHDDSEYTHGLEIGHVLGYIKGAKEQHKIDLEKALAYWHKLLDYQEINPVVFVDFVEYMEKEL